MEGIGHREITIVGGGIAGLSLGVGLRRRGVDVTLIEAGRYPRHRVCGEFISGVDEETLQDLGVADLLEDATPCSTTAWYAREGRFFTNELPAPAVGISRRRLDARMAERFVALGGNLVVGERFRSGGPPEGTVLATGRRRSAGSSWLGLKAHLTGFDLESDLEMHLGDGGYVGLSRIESGKTNLCGLFRQRTSLTVSRDTALTAYLEACGLGLLAKRAGRAAFDPDSHVAVSAFAFGRQDEASDGTLRVGDRHSIIGPFTGNGMSMAFQSAALVMPLLVDYSRGSREWASVVARSEETLQSFFRRRLGFSKAIHPFLTRPAGQNLMVGLARRNLLPFSQAYRVLR
ncbi:MAG: FAD-dependent monooxygenase [Verrucomicrobiales bacterium]